jgi:DNA invertase Pin-like site-specific DNA recombinase
MYDRSVIGASMNKKRSHKLTIGQKREIWKLYNDGFSPSEIASKFNVTSVTVYRIGKEIKYKN